MGHLCHTRFVNSFVNICSRFTDAGDQAEHFVSGFVIVLHRYDRAVAKPRCYISQRVEFKPICLKILPKRMTPSLLGPNGLELTGHFAHNMLEEDYGVDSLILCRCRDLPLDGQVGLELFDLGAVL